MHDFYIFQAPPSPQMIIASLDFPLTPETLPAYQQPIIANRNKVTNLLIYVRMHDYNSNMVV